jgi:RNA recognition motif-containing protein
MAGRSIESEQRKLMTKLYVGNLAFSMTDDTLMQLFTGKGYKVGSARIITDRETGRSRGFGFVELGPEDDAAKAIGEFNGLDIDGRALQVNEARPQEFRGGGGGDRSGGRGYSGGRSGRGGGGRRSY